MFGKGFYHAINVTRKILNMLFKFSDEMKPSENQYVTGSRNCKILNIKTFVMHIPKEMQLSSFVCVCLSIHSDPERLDILKPGESSRTVCPKWKVLKTEILELKTMAAY